jgi:threonylcarbamoyladenosine tRNA methylthiotransferase MtaB
MKRKVAFHTLGCKLNFSETSSIARLFLQRGYEKVSFDGGADIFVINTCSVTDNADKKCRQVVKQARKAANNPFIIVIGCYAQLKPKEISEIRGVDAVLGTNEKFRLLDILEGFEKPEKPIVQVDSVGNADTFSSAFSINDRTRTFLKVQDGCDYSCSFCTIPLARGGSRSDTIEHVLKTANEIAEKGVREIVLTGVNTGDFGIRNDVRQDRFLDLIRELDKIEGINRIRISSIEPNLLSTDIIDFVACSKIFVRHFHIPLQSGSDRILKSMRRRYLSRRYEELVRSIKTAMPDCCIGVDVIVGFPGENEREFLHTYEFLNQLDVSYLHVFAYSERPNTGAITLENKVPLEQIRTRANMLRSLSVKKRRFFYDQFTGHTREVLFENDIDNGQLYGFTDNYIRVAVAQEGSLVNEVRKVQMNGVGADGIMQGQLWETTITA